MIDLYDVTGKIKGYLFHGIEVAREGLKGKLYSEVSGLTKTHNGNLILQIHHFKAVSEKEFDVSDVFKKPSKEELEEIIRQLYLQRKGISTEISLVTDYAQTTKEKRRTYRYEHTKKLWRHYENICDGYKRTY